MIPLRPGSWVVQVCARGAIEDRPRIGKVLVVHGTTGTMDVALYGPDGRRVGREAFRAGSASGIETRARLDDWAAIESPDFEALSRLAYYGRLLRRVGEPPRDRPALSRAEWEKRFSDRLQATLGLSGLGLAQALSEELAAFPATDDGWTLVPPEVAADESASYWIDG